MSEWKTQPLGKLTVLLKDGTHGSFTDFDEGIPLLSAKDIERGKVQIPDDCRKISEDAYKSIHATYELEEFDVLLTIVGTIGRVAVYYKTKNKVTFQRSVAIIRADRSKLYPLYCYHYLNCFEFQQYLESYKNASAQGGVYLGALNKIPLLFPSSLSEQRKIARILSTVDAVIEKTEAAIAKYKAIKQGMMADLFTRGIDLATGKLRPRYEDAPELYKDTDLGWVPKEWEVVKIDNSGVQIIDGDRGSNYPHENELFEHGFCLFLTASNVTANGFVFANKQFITEEKENLLGSGKLERFDIVITTRGTVGNIAYYSDAVQYEHMRINSGMLILRNREEGLLLEFLYESFKNYLFDVDYRRVVSGSAQPQLPMKDLKAFRLLKTSELEQEKIVSICKHNQMLINRELSTLEKLKNLKQALMSDLLTGRVPVKVEEEITEAANATAN